MWEKLASTALETVARLRVKITKVVLIVPTTDLAHLGEGVVSCAKFSNSMDHLVDVVLPCVHLKEPVIGFRSISGVKPAKLVIRNVGSEKLVFLRYNTNHIRLPDSLAKITVNITHMKHLTVHPVKGQVAHSHLCQGDSSVRL